MKKYFTLCMMAVLSALNATAIDIPTSLFTATVEEGKTYALYDVTAGQFVNGEENWYGYSDEPLYHFDIVEDETAEDRKFYIKSNAKAFLKIGEFEEVIKVYYDGKESDRAKWTLEDPYNNTFKIVTKGGENGCEDRTFEAEVDPEQDYYLAEGGHAVTTKTESAHTFAFVSVEKYNKWAEDKADISNYYSSVGVGDYAIYDTQEHQFISNTWGWGAINLEIYPVDFSFSEATKGYYIQTVKGNNNSYLKIEGVDWPAVWKDGTEENRTDWIFTANDDDTYYMSGQDNNRTDEYIRTYGNDGWLAAEPGHQLKWHKVALIKKSDYEIYLSNTPLDVTVTSAGYATLYYEKTALQIPEGIEAFTVHSSADDKIELVAVNGTIPAGEPVVIRGNANDYKFPRVNQRLNKDNANMLRGADSNADMKALDGNYYYYKLADDELRGLGFYWGKGTGGSTFNLGSTGKDYQKAYLVMPYEDSNAAPQRLSWLNADEATAIKTMESNPQGTSAFTLTGMPADQNTKGIVIMNGKKYFRK